MIVERAKDVGALQCGSAFAPQFIENKLKFSAYIREAVPSATTGLSSRR